MKQKIYFDGCSYTFGQSLELYCNDLNIFDENRMSKYVFTKNDLDFIEKHRYSSIVSNHFGLLETNQSKNGKSNGKILYDLKMLNVEDYEYFIIQLTHFNRYFTNNWEWVGMEVTINSMIKEKRMTREDADYAIKNIEKIQLEYFLELEKFFVKYPNKLKIIFHSNEWEEILSKEQIKKYGVSIDGEYMIRRWAEKNNMFINQQDLFKSNKATSNDTHLTLDGHKILANKIIEQL